MSHFKFSFAPLAAVVLAAGLATQAVPAIGADLDPGYADIPQPQQQVTFGSGWYVRGDIAAEKTYTYDDYQPPLSRAVYTNIRQTSDWGYDASLGGGYAMTNGIRGDIVVDFQQPATTHNYASYCYNSLSQGCQSYGSFRSYDALANAYYDIGTWSIFTPYVGGGVGVAFGEVQNTLYGSPEGTFEAHYGYHNLAWALMAGAAIDVYAHTKLDIGYRYLDNGTVNGLKIHYNQVRAGLRYMIDN